MKNAIKTTLIMVGILGAIFLVPFSSQNLNAATSKNNNEEMVDIFVDGENKKISIEMLDSILRKVIDETAATLPNRVNEDTEIISVFYLDGHMQMNYRFLEKKSDEIDEKKLEKWVWDDAVKRYCTEKDMQLLRSRPNSSMQFKYYGKNKNLITNVTIDSKDCKSFK